ncbi:MAG: MotA/TolQ/ExbB proton channel family protein [Desulfobacterales bacterium]|nr:MotA/TolQ/ExbB proton channel family protein [Desulfobacterales bacterium]
MIQKIILSVGAIFFIFLSKSVAGEISPIVNLKSCLLVLGGTLISAFLSFSTETIKDLIHSLGRVFRNEKSDYKMLLKQIENLARLRRLHGIKALESAVDKIENVFLRKGIEMVIDGYDRYEIHNTLEKELELYFTNKQSQKNVLSTMAKVAPVFGFVGTIIGLINVLNQIGEPSQLGQGMSIALLTTLYGLLLSNFIFSPLAKKLSEYTQADALLLTIVLEGIIDICEEKNSKSIFYRLQSYLEGYRQIHTDITESPVPSKTKNLSPLKKLLPGKQSA